MKKQIIKGVPVSLRKIVSKAVHDYRWELGIEIWKIGIAYDHTDKETENPGDFVAASITVNRRYLEATVHIYPKLVTGFIAKKYDTEEIREIIAHEVSHVATQHFWDVATARYCDEGEMKDAWETCTSVIAKLVYQLYKKRK